MGLEYRGKRIFETKVPLVRRDTEIDTRGGLTATEIESHVESYMDVYATRQYVDEQDAKKASLSELDSAGLLLTDKSNIGKPGGLAPLNSSGRIPKEHLSNVPVVGARGPWSPTTANTSKLAITRESAITRIQSLTIPDPGFKWRPLMFASQSFVGGGAVLFFTRMTIRSYTVSDGNDVLGPIVASGRSIGNGNYGSGRISYGTILPRDSSPGFTGSKTFGLYAEPYGVNTGGTSRTINLSPDGCYWFAYIIPTN